MKRLLIAGMTIAMMACDPQKDLSYRFDEMTYSPKETVFKVFAPENARCFVVVNGDSIRMEHKPTVDDTLMTEGRIYKAIVQGDLKGKTYEFVVSLPSAPNGAAPLGGGNMASPGVFAKAVTVNGQKGVVVDLRDTDPEGWANDHGPRPERYADWCVYEMHHRDFSIARSDAQHPGKFLALTEPWAIEHLKELGINAVHILPSYDFGSVDETKPDVPQYNWGYDPVNYNVPEGSYSTDASDPLSRIREFKQMAQALHKAGICVILDVVYNHTYDIEHSNFQRTYPDYYYRTIDHSTEQTPAEVNNGQCSMVNVQYSNGSGCGNETASEKQMMRRFMVESVKYWINEYHIDGFRFDLMGCHDIETMNAIRQAVDEIDPTIFIYGEGWSAGPCALPNEQLAMKANISQVPRVAAFSDEIRDALRGPFNDDTKGAFLAGIPGEEESLKAGIAGMVEHPQVDYSKVNYSDKPWAAEPTQMMSYVSCHDDMCLVDRLKASAHLSPLTSHPSPLIKLDLLAQTAVFTSQGVPFMLSGEELLRTKQGVHNSFESPDSINQLDWTNKERYAEVFDYYKNLIALRRHHPAFRLGTAELVRKHLSFLPVQDCLVAYRLQDAPGDDWQDIIVILNANTKAMKVSVPEGDYTAVCLDGRINEQGLGTVSGPVISVSAQSALILHR
ncbi:MAG: type I pullulanase [Prevotella sp.]|nr:type I pullulanase [Prevotella sp.]